MLQTKIIALHIKYLAPLLLSAALLVILCICASIIFVDLSYADQLNSCVAYNLSNSLSDSLLLTNLEITDLKVDKDSNFADELMRKIISVLRRLVQLVVRVVCAIINELGVHCRD